MVFGGIWGIIFDHFSLLFSIKKLVDFSTDFSSIFGWIFGGFLDENRPKIHANPMLFFERFLLDF